MTSTARDTRYGRRGGRWAETRTGADVCATCCNGTARYTATRGGESWPVCTSCRDQGVRVGSEAIFTPIGEGSG